jgi:hypothetical protein
VSTQTLAIQEFLEARLIEDAAFWRGLCGSPRRTGKTYCHRALGDVAVKRSILALHVPYQRIIGLGCETCLGSANKGKAAAFPGWPCPTVKLLAAPYREHPDFCQEWAV